MKTSGTHIFFISLFFLLHFAACSPQSDKSWSPELLKVVLNDVCFPGDHIRLSNIPLAIVLSADSSGVRFRIPGNEISSAAPGEIEKIHSDFIFRGTEPGMPLHWVLMTEPGKPRYQDELGISYEYTLGKNNSFRVDYFTVPGEKPRRIRSIEADISFGAEADAIHFYRELSEWFTEKNGTPSGQLGNFIWQVPENALSVRMELSGRKKNISLSVRPEELQIRD